MKKTLFRLYWYYLDISSYVHLFLKKNLLHLGFAYPNKQNLFIPSKEYTEYEAIIFIPELNWELELIDEIKKVFKSHVYRDIESRGFFTTKKEWLLWRKETSKNIYNYVNKITSDNPSQNYVFFSYLADFNLDPKIARKLALKNNLLMVNFNWDDVQHFSRSVYRQPIGVKEISRNFNINYSLSRIALTHYKFNGANSKLWKGSELDISDDDFPLPENRINKVLFVGAKFGIREELIKQIRKSGIEVDCFGRGWGTRMLTNEEYREYVPKYHVVIGNSLIGHSQYHMIVKGRDFEIPNFGGLYLTSYFDGLEDFYNTKNEILTYESIKEAISIIKDVLDKPSLYENIRYNGWRKTRKFNTWRSRIKTLHQDVTAYLEN